MKITNAAAILGAKGGSSTSEAKQAAARANGKHHVGQLGATKKVLEGRAKKIFQKKYSADVMPHEALYVLKGKYYYADQHDCFEVTEQVAKKRFPNANI